MWFRTFNQHHVIIAVSLQTGTDTFPTWRQREQTEKGDGKKCLLSICHQPLLQHSWRKTKKDVKEVHYHRGKTRVKEKTSKATSCTSQNRGNGLLGQSSHYSGPHQTVSCDQWWYRNVWDGTNRPGCGSGEVPTGSGARQQLWVNGIRLPERRGQQRDGQSCLWPLPVHGHHLQLGLWHSAAFQHR